jgi:hypothetical protein
MKIIKIPVCVAAVLMAAHSSYGVVVLQDSYAETSPGGAPTDLGGGIFGYEIDVTSSFSAAGHGKMVLVYSSWDDPGADAIPTNVTNVTYDGAALTEAIFANDNGTLVTAGVFYLDNVVTDGTLRIELSRSVQTHFGFGLYALDGLKAGVQDAASGRDPLTDATVTMTTDSGFFVQEAARNNQSLADDPGDDYQTLYNYNVDSYRALSQFQVTTAAGDYLAPIGNTGVNFRIVAAAAFEADPIPEPGSAAMLGLTGLGLILRRRRS